MFIFNTGTSKKGMRIRMHIIPQIPHSRVAASPPEEEKGGSRTKALPSEACEGVHMEAV